MLGDFPNDTITEQSALLIPGSLPKVIGNVLHEAGHDVCARRSQRMVGIGRDYAVHPQLPGNVSELGDVVAAFGKFEGRHECVEGPLERRVTRRRARETRFLRKREVYFGAW